MPWTYILECRDGTYYVGSTVNLERRVSEHNLGFGAKYTRVRSRRPVKLVWSSEFNRMDEAFWYEKQIQGWGREKRMALIEGRLDLLEVLARNRQLDRPQLPSGAALVRQTQPRSGSTTTPAAGVSTGSTSGG
jgi:putative endonuclease